MAAAAIFFTERATTQLNDLLFEVCEELQLSPPRYAQADQRYRAVADVLEADGSPLAPYRPRIYPQGSMRLGTTVRPICGPCDLDFVCEISLSHLLVDPMKLIQALYHYLKAQATYRNMVALKTRCVRLTYENEFHMDILPACEDHQAGSGCIQVPDREVSGWKPSNPTGYATWFEHRAMVAVRRVLAAAQPLPLPEGVEDKWPLQLAVQLIKRWRDVRYGSDDLAPISVVLTTLAAEHYNGEQSTSVALSCILDRIVEAVASANRAGRRLRVCNPSNPEENLSERWDDQPDAYEAFAEGMSEFRTAWSAILSTGAVVHKKLERLFGEPVPRALAKQARRLQEARRQGGLSVNSMGMIVGSSAAALPIRANTFHGD